MDGDKVQVYFNRLDDSQSLDEYSGLLHKTMQVLLYLPKHQHVVKGLDIWQENLHLGNIYVPKSPTDFDDLDHSNKEG